MSQTQNRNHITIPVSTDKYTLLLISWHAIPFTDAIRQQQFHKFPVTRYRYYHIDQNDYPP